LPPTSAPRAARCSRSFTGGSGSRRPGGRSPQRWLGLRWPIRKEREA